MLPQSEQVARGQKLLQMIAAQEAPVTPQRCTLAGETKFDNGKVVEFDWNVVVKKGFIEVVIPACERSIKRSMSESALPRFQTPQNKWTSLASEKLDMSDASTNVSIEAEDLDASFRSSTKEEICWSSEDGDAEAEMQLSAPYQCIQESWWMPMGYDTAVSSSASTAYNQACMGFGQASMGYEQAQVVSDPSGFMGWADTTLECCTGNADAGQGQEWRTTVMNRNMPNNYTREMLRELVDSLGFAGTYDFAYLPVDFQSQAGLGYAFINFATVADALLCFERFEGFSNWKVPSEKVCTVTWSSPTQGLAAHIERYKNSPVMHQSLPDEWKPVLLQQGMRVTFPPPSKPIKTPKVRQTKNA